MFTIPLRAARLSVAATIIAGGVAAAAPGAQAAAPFSAPFRFFAGTAPQDLAVADFTGTGRPSLVTTDVGCVGAQGCNPNPQVWVRLGGPLGTFGPATPYGLDAVSGPVVTGDFNGDGHQDIAVATGDAQTGISILPGNGLGGFGGPVDLAPGTVRADGLLSADLNGDDVPDLIGRNYYGALTIRLSDGHGGFSAPSTYDLSVSPTLAIFNGLVYTTSIAAGDLNRDGHQDLVVSGRYTAADGSSHSVTEILLGDGHGGFNRHDLPFGFGRIAIGDVTGDGTPDLVGFGNGYPAYPGGDMVTTLLGDGHGNFGAPITSAVSLPVSVEPLLTDLDSDGNLDILAAGGGQVTAASGDGHGHFGSAESGPTGGQPLDVATGDFLGDGHPSIAVLNGLYNPGRESYQVGGNVAVFYNLTPPAWWPSWAGGAWPSILAQWTSGAWPSQLRPWDINSWLPLPPLGSWQSIVGPFAGTASTSHHPRGRHRHLVGPAALRHARKPPRWLTPSTVSRWAATARRHEHSAGQ